jgi:hypothetical protein
VQKNQLTEKKLGAANAMEATAVATTIKDAITIFIDFAASIKLSPA